MIAIELGAKYRDRITGAEGVATARCEYLDDVESAKLEWPGADGEPKSAWVTVTRLEPVVE